LRGKWVLVAMAALCSLGTTQAFCQFKTDLVNEEGATAPCMGIGPVGGPAAKKCVELVLQEGFLRVDDVGQTGLTFGKAGKDDGVITAIQSGSSAEQAGLQVGDVITAVEDHAVKPTPGRMAAKATFGRRGETLHLKIRRNGAEQEVSFVRVAQNAPQGPKSPNMFIQVRPVVDWRSKFVPCMGMGPLGPAAIEMCVNRFKPYGFIKSGDCGSTGLQLNLERPDAAIVSAVEADSAAAKAGVQVGDEIVAVEGQPLTASVGEEASEQLFGKAGDQFHVKVQRGQEEKTVVLKLGAKPAN
jgi:predicted metalloprotease with PDZ domain